MEKVIDKYDKLDEKITDNKNINNELNGGGKKIIKKCSNILCFIISDYLNYIIKKSKL